MERMNNEQILAQALVDLEIELDLCTSQDPILDKLWEIIHYPETWSVVQSIMQGDQG